MIDAGHGDSPLFDADRPARAVVRAAKDWTKQGGALLLTNRAQREDGERQEVGVDRPAPAVSTKSGSQWKRTAIMGDPRVFPPNGHHPDSGDPSWSTRAVKVELWELAVLQDFPPDFPFRGTKTQRAQQIGNAIPPGLARAVLGVVA